MAGGSSRLGTVEGIVELDNRISRVEALLDTLRQANPITGIQGARVRATPPAVSGLSTFQAPGGIALTWAASPIRDLLYYEIQVSESSLFSNPTIYRTFENDFNYRVPSFSALTYFRVRAVNSLGIAGPWSSPVSSTVGSSVFVGGSGAFFDPDTNWVGRRIKDKGNEATTGNVDVTHDFQVTQFQGDGFQLIPFSQVELFIEFYYPATSGLLNQATLSLIRKPNPADPTGWATVDKEFMVQFPSTTFGAGVPKSHYVFPMMFLPFTPPAGMMQYDLRVHIESGTYEPSPGFPDNPCLAITPVSVNVDFIKL